MAGGRRTGSSNTASKVTTKVCCCTSSDSVRQRIRCRPRVIAPIARPTSGRKSTIVNCFTRGRSSRISSRICGSTFAVFATNSCVTHGSDYFENSRQATFVQQEYAIRNPMNFVGYGEHCWGFTACDGPGWVKRVVNGVEREFFDYIARGAPFGPDDGTVAPWVVVASLPFAPEIVIPTVRHFARMDLGMTGKYGFKPSFNQSFAVPDSPTGWWVTPYHFGIDQGPVVLMIENYRTGLLWNIMRRCPAVVAGLRRAGFTRRLALARSREAASRKSFAWNASRSFRPRSVREGTVGSS